MEHPQIDWPRRLPGKKSHLPDPRYIENTVALFDAYGIKVRWNLMRHALELSIPGYSVEKERAENASFARVVELAERNGLQEKQTLSHLSILAQSYHPVQQWMTSKPWDGKDRSTQLFETIELDESMDAGLARLLFDRWMISCARAVMPERVGERKFTPQGVLVFQGPQGIGKTEWIKALAPPGSDWILYGRTVDPHERDDVQQATSVWLVELGELDATYRKTDVAALKAFVTQDTDTYRSAYARREERVPRRTVMAASVNPRNFLPDDTGNRRWWTIACKSLNWQHGIDMQQFWAEVYALTQDGAQWWLSPDEAALLSANNRNHEIQSALVCDLWETWRPVTVQLAGGEPAARVTMGMIWSRLPGRANRAKTTKEATELADALRRAGCENKTLLHGAKTYNVVEINPQVNETYTPGRWGNP